jgi:hypothetical protein
MKVVILGAGPAGLMAAAAVARATQHDSQVAIISDTTKPSELYGAQYLHAPIPSYTPAAHIGHPAWILYELQGSADDYRRKIYGPMWDGTVSPEDLDRLHQAWDIRSTYKNLWETFGDDINPVFMDPAGMRALSEGATPFGKPDLIISSIPKPALCPKGHQFKSAMIWAAGEAPELGIELPYKCEDFTVKCNGEDHPSWYRMSRIFGRLTVEWPEYIRPPFGSAAQVQKPLENNCDCWPEVLHVGRYGKWEKGVLTHHAYEEVLKHVASLA